MSKDRPNVLLADEAILIATEEELEEKSPWYTDGTYVFRFIRVPQFLYNTAAAHLRSEMRKQKPQPPVIQKSGRKMTNKADPFYKESMERWKQEWEDLSQESSISTSMFCGIELQGPMPPEGEWLNDVLDHFLTIGISEDQAYGTYYHNRERLHELWFKKFVLLRSKAVMQTFANFQGQDEDEEGDEDLIDEEDEDAAFAADLFQSDSKRNLAQ